MVHGTPSRPFTSTPLPMGLFDGIAKAFGNAEVSRVYILYNTGIGILPNTILKYNPVCLPLFYHFWGVDELN